MKTICYIVSFLCLVLNSHAQTIELKKGQKFIYRSSRFEQSTQYREERENPSQDEALYRNKLQIEVVKSEKEYYLLKALSSKIDSYRRLKNNYMPWYSSSSFSRDLVNPDVDSRGIQFDLTIDSMLFKISKNGKIFEHKNLNTTKYQRSQNKEELDSSWLVYTKRTIQEFIFSLPESPQIGSVINQDTIEYKIVEKVDNYLILEKIPVENQEIVSSVKIDAKSGFLIESTVSEKHNHTVNTYSYGGSHIGKQPLAYFEKSEILKHNNRIVINKKPYYCEYMVNNSSKDTVFNETNVTIKGTIKNPPENKTISLRWWESRISGNTPYMITTPIDKNNHFEFRLNIDDIKKVSLYPRGLDFWMYLMPGDDIYVEFDYLIYHQTLTCSGKGSNKINYALDNIRFDEREKFDLNRFDNKCRNIQFRMDSIEYEKYCLKEINKKVDFLNTWKPRLSPEVYLAEYWMYQIKLVDVLQDYVANQQIKEKKMYVSSSGDTSYHFRVSIIKKKLDVSKYIHPDNDLMTFYNGYENFIFYYIKRNIQDEINSITGISELYNPDNENAAYNFSADYNLYHTQFSGKTAHFLKYYTVKSAFQYVEWSVCDELYKRFTYEYPLSDLTQKLKKTYENMSVFKPGQPIYDFELEDLNGKKVSLSDYRGKALYLIFLHCSLHPKSRSGVFEIYVNHLVELIDGENAEIIYISRDDIDRTKTFFESRSINGTVLIGKNIEEKLQTLYLADHGTKYIILDVDGKIVYKVTPHPSQIVYDPSLLLKACKPLFRKDESKQTIFILKIVTFSLLGLLFLAFIIILINRKRAERRYKLATLNTRIRELELTAIRAQMNPHFLYNCLNSIQNLVQKNQTEEAHIYLSKFADLIRLTLKKSDKEESPLQEEIELLKQYVELEQLRFNIDFSIHIDKGIDPFSVYIPPLLMQPIVENAIVHGLSQKQGDKKLTINIKKTNGHICLSVQDNGIGREASAKISKVSTGKGLKFTKERLDLISEKYGAEYHLSIHDVETQGTRVEVCFMDE